MMNIFDNQKLASTLVNSKKEGIDDEHGEDEDVNTDAHNLELVKKFFEAGQEGKFEKALNCAEMLFENIWRELEEEEHEYDGMKFLTEKPY